MTTAIKSQLTEIHFIKPASPSELVKLGQVASFDGLGGSAGEIDTSHFDSVRKEFIRGLRDGGTVSMEVIFAPNDPGQIELFALDDDGDAVRWCISLSDGTTDPTANGTGGITQPSSSDRTSFAFDAFVQQATISGQTDDKITVSLQLRVTGDITRVFKA